MQTSEKLNELIAALANARLKFSKIERTKTNPHFRSTYAPLESIMPAIDKALAEEGLVLVGDLRNREKGVVTVTTRLMHISEQFIESAIDVNYELGQLQKLGADVTYIRRYSINTMLELASDEDLDEQGTMERQRAERTTPRPMGVRPPHPDIPEAGTTPAPHVGDEASSRQEVIRATTSLLQHYFPHESDNAYRSFIPTNAMTAVRPAFGVEKWSEMKTKSLEELREGYANLYRSLEPQETTEPDIIDAEDDVPTFSGPEATQEPSGETQEIEETPETAHEASVQPEGQESTVRTYATSKQVLRLTRLAEQVGEQATADLQGVLDRHPEGLPMIAYKLAQERLQARQAMENAQGAEVGNADASTDGQVG